MDHINQLIENTAAGEYNKEKAQQAVAELISIGMPVVPSIVKAIETGLGATWRLCEILLLIRDQNIVPVFIDLLQAENTDLAITAIKGLGRSKDERALQPLLNSLSNCNKHLVIDALGELGNSQAVKKLLQLSEEILSNSEVSKIIHGQPDINTENFDESQLDLLIRIIIALAKLGNYQVAPTAIPLINYHCDDDYSNSKIIRTNAVQSLQYIAIPGMFSALQSSLHDDYYEVRLQAVDAIFYLGIKEIIPELISCIEDEDYTVVNNILFRLEHITGTYFEDDVQINNLQDWWKQHQNKYDSYICYRLGRPLHLPNIIELLDEPNQQKPVLEELKIITGIDFSMRLDITHQNEGELKKIVQNWWEKEGHRFKDGVLYKYGHEQNINNIF
ncbi:MAG TPA: HEAT repeat domain-containing protein [Nostocaceae cyanobacterium]|nr:HEAT repeat domain-containing protein [Nostocaceae cyanobacterium]